MGTTHQEVQINEPVHDFCHGIYVALLNDMKKSLE
jgi:hypothetical protein